MPDADQILGTLAWAIFNLPAALEQIDDVRAPEELEWHTHPQRFLEADGNVLLSEADHHLGGYTLQTVVAIDRERGCAAVSHGGMEPYIVRNIDHHFVALLQLGRLPGYLDRKPWMPADAQTDLGARLMEASVLNRRDTP